MRTQRHLLRDLITDGVLIASALLLGCNTKVGTTGVPDAATKTETMTSAPAAPTAPPVKPVTASAPQGAPAPATQAVAPPAPPQTAPAMQPAVATTTTGLKPPMIPGVSNFLDKNIPIPPGVNVMLSGVQISDGPVNETGTSAHFRLQGGVYMSK